MATQMSQLLHIFELLKIPYYKFGNKNKNMDVFSLEKKSFLFTPIKLINELINGSKMINNSVAFDLYSAYSMDKIVCPQLIKKDDTIEYSTNIIQIKLRQDGSFYDIQEYSTLGNSCDVEIIRLKIDACKILDIPNSNYSLISDIILKDFGMKADAISNIYESKYIEMCMDKILILFLLDIHLPLIRFITKNIIKLIGHLSIELKKVS
uniref:Uncharacterized protein n=1 Tax=viral metagenome TaxID=1070528 RepID=A0A6C0C7P6_9ZZZZ